MKEFNGVSCVYLEKKEVGIKDNSVTVGFEGVDDDSQLVEGQSGICITGQRGVCPKNYNCGQVKITAVVAPFFIEIEPVEAKKGQ